MKKEPTNKEITYKEKYRKNTGYSLGHFKNLVNTEATNVYLKEVGTCNVDGTEKEFMTVTVYANRK